MSPDDNFKSKKSNNPVHYQIIETKDASSDVPKELSTVYSLLCILSEDGIDRARFFYDIARKKDAALIILKTISDAAPDFDEIEDYLSEIL